MICPIAIKLTDSIDWASESVSPLNILRGQTQPVDHGILGWPEERSLPSID
jgi:hypothetical protein